MMKSPTVKALVSGQDDPLTLALAPPPDETPEQRELRLKHEAEAKRISDGIDESIRQEKVAWKRHQELFKLLLLGQSESGKSTTLKNFQLTFAPEAWQAERNSWRSVVQLNLVRSVNLILDVLADELNSLPSRPDSVSASIEHAVHAGSNPTSPIPADADDDDDEGHSPGSSAEPAAPLRFTNKHALLKLRLAPLRHVEADLKRSLGAASSEDTGDTLSSDVGHDLRGVSFEDAYGRSARGVDLCIRSNRSWRDALNKQFESGRGKHSRTASAERVKSPPPLNDATEVIAGCAEDIYELWNDKDTRELLRRRKLRLEESSGFFLDQVRRIAARDYEPTNDDVVRARLRTLGVQEYNLVFEKTTGVERQLAKEWVIYDVGGSRTTRAAWVPFFEDAHAILFLAPISCFDERLAEARHVNRLDDSVALWLSICRSKLLARCIIVLFLNKYDLLAKKMKTGIMINKYLSSYGDRENSAPVFAKYLHSKFKGYHKELSPNPRSFYGYITTVVNTEATSSTLASVRDGLIQQYLQNADLL